MTTYWNSELYLRFESERTRPSVDLVNALGVDSPKNIIDIGCGPGNSTAVLAERFPDADIIGVDNSIEMIEKARSLYPEISFSMLDASGDLSASTGAFDVVFSNSCIQWLPDHSSLIRDLMSLLVPNGVLAVQIPNNFNEPIHRIIREISSSPRWTDKFTSSRPTTVLSRSEYFNLLSEISSDFQLWETVYYHRMPSHEAILDWYRATGLRPYLSQLNTADSAAFEGEIYSRICEEYPVESCGEIIFPFPRLFFIATR